MGRIVINETENKQTVILNDSPEGVEGGYFDSLMEWHDFGGGGTEVLSGSFEVTEDTMTYDIEVGAPFNHFMIYTESLVNGHNKKATRSVFGRDLTEDGVTFVAPFGGAVTNSAGTSYVLWTWSTYGNTTNYFMRKDGNTVKYNAQGATQDNGAGYLIAGVIYHWRAWND